MSGQNGLKRAASPDADEGADGASGEVHQGRQRSRAACAPCRQRKRKCDGKYPCGTCVRYEYQCEYSATKRSSITNGESAAHTQESPSHTGKTPPSIVQLQKHPLTAPGARFHHRGILDPVKTRFVRANSAIAFPRVLGMDMESEIIPRLHSFAWHTGIRGEPIEAPVDITTLLTWAEMQTLAKVYFRIVKPEFGLVDETEFNEQAAARFNDPRGLNDVDAMLLGVGALGSFFSSTPHSKETEMVFAARAVLTQRIVNGPTTSNITGWILRTIYLRLTSRPHGSWMTSCITMHQAEASGLHKELQTIAVVYPAAPSGDHKLQKTRRKLFHIARALNIILSFEYGRSRVTFDVTTTKRFAAESGTFAHHFVDMADHLPSDYVDRDREPDPPAALGAALTKLEEMHSDSSFMTMLKADLAFSIYRRLWLMSLTDAKDRADTVITIGKAALDAATRMLNDRLPWWNIVHAPFQFLCVCLAVSTPRSLGYIQGTMALLHRITQIYDTHMVREAYNQASALLKMSKKRKEKELEALNAVTDAPAFVGDHPSVGSCGSGGHLASLTEAVPNFDWTADLGSLEWDMFLNPDLVMSTQQALPTDTFNGHDSMTGFPTSVPQPGAGGS
ncbi:C6 zinc finger protein domain protein [Teratosphaeria destructans]|uniref:C6 zinc finger protein domain protein n=1 Tax=Teratosphaeria destructans TaxID=418781 RepID=A0A9W7T2C1_9PEZI|nr:C6 zinc finger protein domain protein [Teratosphaeria destructans]